MRDKFLICKLLPSLDYPDTLDYKEVLLTKLSTSYAGHQRCFFCKLFPFLGFCSQHYSLGENILTLTAKKKNSQVKLKVLNSRKNFSTLVGNSQLYGKILNCRGKFLTLGKILNSLGNS